METPELESAPLPKLKDGESWARKLATDAVVLGALSAFGYCIAFAFEAGYASHFGYPVYLISPTPNVIVTALAVVLVVVGAAWPLLDVFEVETNRKAALTVFLAALLCLIVVHSYTMSNFSLWALLPLIWAPVGFFLARWQSAHGSSERRATGRKLRWGAFATLTIYAGYLLASLLGNQAATRQQAFYFLKGKPDFAVVRLYDSLAVAVRYDFEKHEFLREYKVIRVGGDQVELNLERVAVKTKRLPVVRDDN